MPRKKQPAMKYEVIESLLKITKDEWHDLRSTGLGGSDAGAVFGESPWTSAFALWAQKSGRVERNVTENEAMAWGTLLEDSVAEKFAADYNKPVVRWPVMLRSVAHPFMLANLDFVIVEGGEFEAGVVTSWEELTPPPGTITAILEIKTTGIVGRPNHRAWEDDGVPRTYELQGLHYTCVLGPEVTNSVVFAALVAGEGLVVRQRDYTPEQQAEAIQRETEFWDLVKSGTPPEVDGHNATLDTLGALYPTHQEGVVAEADEFVYETYEKFVQTNEAKKQLEQEVKALRAQLEQAVGDAEALAFMGQTLFTFKATKDTEAFDVKAFKEAMPDVWAQFVRPKSGYRVMRLKGEA